MILLAIILSAITSAHKVVNICSKDRDVVVNDATTNTSQGETHTCARKNCACHSIDGTSANPTSNTVFNITEDVMLSRFLVGSDHLVNVIITAWIQQSYSKV